MESDTPLSVVAKMSTRKSRPIERSKPSPKRKVDSECEEDFVAATDEVDEELTDAVLGSMLLKEGKGRVLGLTRRYRKIVMGLFLENAKLKDQVRAYKDCGVQQKRPGAVAQPVVKPPVNTWAVVVKGKGEASKEVVAKVKDQVGPTFGVRVHEVRQTKEGAVIRTLSRAERQKIVNNQKFGEVGLKVSIMDRLGPKIVVRDVQKTVSTDEFMEAVYGMNLKNIMPCEKYMKAVRLVTNS